MTVPRSRRLPLLVLPIALAVSALGPACTGSQVHTGIRIGDETLKQFKAGETRETWLRAVLGDPTSEAVVADEPSVHILRYSTQDLEDPGIVGSLLDEPHARVVSTVYFVVRDGKVERFWADRAEDSGLFRRKPDSGEKLD